MSAETNADGVNEYFKNVQKIEEKTAADIEKEQEQKLKQKYGKKIAMPKPNMFLQKQLNRGRNYFDSGDYNMKKATKKTVPETENKPAVTPAGPTIEVAHSLPPADVEHIPIRKTSVASKLATMS